MAKSSKSTKYGAKSVKEIQVKPQDEIKLVEASEKLVPLRFLRNVKYVWITASGERIEWNGAGSIRLVTREEATILLAKFRKGGCCGSIPRKVFYFEEVI